MLGRTLLCSAGVSRSIILLGPDRKWTMPRIYIQISTSLEQFSRFKDNEAGWDGSKDNLYYFAYIWAKLARPWLFCWSNRRYQNLPVEFPRSCCNEKRSDERQSIVMPRGLRKVDGQGHVLHARRLGTLSAELVQRLLWLPSLSIFRRVTPPSNFRRKKRHKLYKHKVEIVSTINLHNDSVSLDV